MNRPQNSFVDEQLAQIQSAHDELRYYFADYKTMQIRPATTYDLSDKSRICLWDLRDAPNHEIEAICQQIRNMQRYMLIAQYNDDSPNDESLRALCEQQAKQGRYFLLNLLSCSKEQDPTWDTSLGFRTNLPALVRSFAETGKGSPSSLRFRETSCGSCSRIRHRTIPAKWIGATVDGTFFTTWSTSLTGNQAKVDRKNAERINQELQKKLCQTFQTEAAIDLACDHDRVLRDHFLQVARCHGRRYYHLSWKKFTSRDIWNKRKTRTTKPWAKRELFRQHRNLGHPQPTELARALRHPGARREAVRFVLKELRCPTCEARLLPLPHRPGMLRCLPFNQCIGVDLVVLEVRDGTSARALNGVCWGTGLQIVQPL